MDFIDMPPGANILESGADLQVIPVNCVPGVMGKGLAKAYADRYCGLGRVRWLNGEHARACEIGTLAPGRCHLAAVPGLCDPSQELDLLLFPTKRHWRGRSYLPDITAGLTHFVSLASDHYANDECPWGAIAFPALGCGLGGLPWAKVRDLIVLAIAPLAHLDVKILLYPPHEEGGA